MNDAATPSKGRSMRTFLASPWGIAAILLGGFLLAQVYLGRRDQDIQITLEGYAPFATPPFELQFSKKFPYDPHSFVGRGARAGFWQWTPEGLVLTDEGRKYFEEAGDQFISRAAAGRRRIKRLRGMQSKDGPRQYDFFYEWVEVSPPAAVLLAPPPRTNEEYLGSMMLVREGGEWRVNYLLTRDFDETMAHLQDIASGVLK